MSFAVAAAAFVLLGRTQAAVYTAPATDRSKTELSGSWKFVASNTLTGAEVTTFDDSAWQSVTVPHTWNVGVAGSWWETSNQYTNSWYRKSFTVASVDSGKRVYLYFDRAGTQATVYLNGMQVGVHTGPTNSFIFDVTAQVVFGGNNVLAVKVDNTSKGWALPAKFYGGLIGKVWLLETNGKYAVDPTHFASGGVYVRQSAVSAASASVAIETRLRNTDTVAKTFTVNNIFTDAGNNIVATVTGTVSVAANTKTSTVQSGSVSNPNLWSRSSPYIYKVFTEVWADGVAKDVVTDTTGFRFFSMTDSDFTLNGVSMRLRGVDYSMPETDAHGGAVTDAEVTADFNSFDDLGVNSVRLAHWEFPKVAYAEADTRGLILMSENGFTWDDVFVNTQGDDNTREMVYQNFNHPSVLFWGGGNEKGTTDMAHFAQVIRDTAPNGYVTLASNDDDTTGTNMDFKFMNFYAGWYGGTYNWETHPFHRISEYGAGGKPNDHQSYTSTSFSIDGANNGGFEPEEYQQLVLERAFQSIFVTKSTQVQAAYVWVFRDVIDTKYHFENYNTKGLVGKGGNPKDTYYLFKSFLRSDVPVVRLVGKGWYLRQSVNAIKAYSNRSSLTLTVNGVSKGTLSNGAYTNPTITTTGKTVNNVFYWTNALSAGRNDVVVSDGAGNTDTSVIYYTNNAASLGNETGAVVQNIDSSLLNETYDAMTLGNPPTGWTTTLATNTSAVIAVDPANAANQVVKLVDSNTGGTATFSKTFPSQVGKVTAQWNYRADATGKWTRFCLMSGATAATEIYDSGNNNSLVWRNSAGTDQLVQAISANTTYTIRVDADPSLGTADVYVNGTKLLTGVSFRVASTTLDGISFNSGNSTTTTGAYLDSVSVTNGNNAYFINRQVTSNVGDELMVYHTVDGSMENTFVSVPSVLSGGKAIATSRMLTRPTNLTFTINPSVTSADVLVVFTGPGVPAFVTNAGLTNTYVTGQWRVDQYTMADYKVYYKNFPGGTTINLGSSAVDYIVIVK